MSRIAKLTKKQIRSKILLKLRTQKEDARNRKSRLIENKLFRARAFRKAEIVMFYIAFDGEVNTQDMIKEARKLGKIIAVPICKRDRVTIKPCLLRTEAKLNKGLYGICEPAVKTNLPIEDLDLVIVPGIAFDKKGNRIGRGRGCYDRFLKKIPVGTNTIGLAFDFQILPVLPAQKHDFLVDRVISN